MPVDWGDYRSFDPGVDRPLHEVSRREAREHFERLMAEKPARKQALAELLARNGVELDRSERSLRELGEWFCDNVEPDPRDPERLAPRWYAVVNDIALYLGDILIERRPGLRWELFTAGDRDMSYQRPVIMGFNVSNPHFNVDFDWAIGVEGHCIVAGEPGEPDALVEMLRAREQEADGTAPWLAQNFDVDTPVGR